MRHKNEHHNSTIVLDRARFILYHAYVPQTGLE